MKTSEIALSTAHAIVIENPEELAGVVKELLYTPDIDALVIRGFATTAGMREQNKRVTSIPLIQMIGRNIKHMREVNTIVSDFWSQEGYSDYKMCQHSMAPSLTAKRGDSSRHTDFPATVVSEFRGPLSMSISAAGNALYGIERPAETFRYDDGSFNKLKWQQWKNSPAPSGPLRTYVGQAGGDAVLFVNHPTQSFHEVTVLEDEASQRIAGLYDYCVYRIE